MSESIRPLYGSRLRLTDYSRPCETQVGSADREPTTASAVEHVQLGGTQLERQAPRFSSRRCA
uniref:hypothetical protein n=1 Tax=Arthrobacter sp. Hiyo1 TaxID=1588020 RepID=UPI0030F3C37C